MFKRIFWIGAGIVAGVVMASKAQAYVRANTPRQAREFVLGPDEDHVAQRTLSSMIAQFQSVMGSREEELNKHYEDRFSSPEH